MSMSKEKLEQLILHQEIETITEEYVLLKNGVKLMIKLVNYDCCANGWGEFTPSESYGELEAVITDINYSEPKIHFNGDGNDGELKITFLHNQHPLFNAQINGHDGNGGYYFSVTSLLVYLNEEELGALATLEV